MNELPLPYEYEFSPDEAREIVTRTWRNVKSGGDANFRTHSRLAGNTAFDQVDTTTRKYVEAMRGGSWVWTDAAPIRTTPGRDLCSDGLHRLAACAIAGMPLRAIVWEVPAGYGTDTGSTRTLTQLLRHRGVANPNVKGAVARFVLARAYGAVAGIAIHTAGTVHISNQDVIRFLDEYDITPMCSGVSSAGLRGFGTIGYGAFLVELGLRPGNDGEWKLFHDDFLADDLPYNDPLAVLRLKVLTGFHRSGKRLPKEPTIAALNKAFRLREMGTELTIWKAPPPTPSTFPAGYDPAVLASWLRP